MSPSVAIDTRDIATTPVFKHVTVEDVPASEREGRAVMKTVEAVEVRFAGSKLYSPVFPTDAMWRRDGHRTITYAERWADQYKEFLAGHDQRASGTPLELLKAYGISDAQLSICRALRIYSIEALHSLEGSNLKNLQMNANPLKDMAGKFIADRASGASSAGEIALLKAEIERLNANMIPRKDSTPQEIEAALAKGDAEAKEVRPATEDDGLLMLSNEELKERYAAKAGRKPMGNPSRETLITHVRELEAA